jgi:hypothetical protein
MWSAGQDVLRPIILLALFVLLWPVPAAAQPLSGSRLDLLPGRSALGSPGGLPLTQSAPGSPAGTTAPQRQARDTSSSPAAIAQARELFAALLHSTWSTSELPSGFSVGQVAQMEAARGTVEQNLIGTILVELDGPDLADRVIYEVFPLTADARRRVSGISLESGQTRTDRFTPRGFDDPATCLSFHDTATNPEYGGTVCIVHVESVIVYGSSALAGDSDRGNVDHAVALARVGVDHLKQVRAGLPDGMSAAGPNSAIVPPSLAAARLIEGRLAQTSPGDLSLPTGFSVARVSTPPSLDQAILFGVVGSILLDVKGLDDSNAILYEVYPDVPSALSRFEQTGPSGDATPSDSFRPAGFEQPARCYSFFVPSEQAGFGATFCLALVENVMVLGASVREGDYDRGVAPHAVGLTQAGVSHLERVLSDLPSGTIADTNRPGRAVLDEGSSHVRVGTPVERRHHPPASGPHYPILLPRGVYPAEQDEGLWIHNLEHGYIVLLYNCPTACPELLAQLQRFYDRAPPSAAYGYQKLVILPYSSMPSRLAIVAWNRIDELEQYDEQRLLRFYEAYHDRGPEDAP